MSRTEAEWYAKANGYFWLPCPRCLQYFGGHEWRAETVKCIEDSSCLHGACCPKVSDQADWVACRGVHSRSQ